jgi:outer membrane protein TolC
LERQFFDAELGLARFQRDAVLAVARLYKALGSGWES